VYKRGEQILRTKRKSTFFKDGSGLLVGICLLTVFLCIGAKGFSSWYNIHNVAKDFSILLVVSSGVTLAILLGKIDMSAGSVMSLAAIVTTILLANGINIVFALLAGMASGALVGCLNGYLIGVLKFDHFVTTFATMGLAKGIALVICNGNIISSNSSTLLFLGNGKVLGIFLIIWLAALIFAIMAYITNRTRFGYKIYSVGGSEQAARLSGVQTWKVYMVSFIISGILAAIGGILMAGKANSGNATLGDGYEFNAIATVLIGGTPFDGGKGGLFGTALGALFISILKNGLSLLGFTPAWQYALIGVAILFTIIVDVALNERRKNEERRRVEA
jgi:ribose transport system permease protein